MKKTIIACIAILFLSVFACAQGTTEIVLSVGEMPPRVTNPHLSDPIRVYSGTDNLVKCNATIRDLNSITEVVALHGILWSSNYSSENAVDNPATHYTTTDFNLTPQTITKGFGVVAFNVQQYAVQGLWYCKIIAVDATDLTGYNTTNATVYPQSCSNNAIDPGEDLADCGGICPACFNVTAINASGVGGASVHDSAYINYQSSQESKVTSAVSSSLTITSVNRSGLLEGEGVISAENIRVNTGNLTMPAPGDYEVPVEINIPANAILGHYEGVITIQTDTGRIVSIPAYIKVQLQNVPPEVRSVHVTYPILLSENETTEFTCNATVFDANGFDDIGGLDFFVAHKAQVTEDIAFIGSEFEKTSENTGYASGKFIIGSNAPGGGWLCTITARDKMNASGKNTTYFDIFPASCSNNMPDGGEQMTDCGGICPPCLEGRRIRVDLMGGTEVTEETIFYSNAPKNLRILGINATDIISEGGVIDKNKVSAKPQKFTIEPRDRKRVSVTIDVPKDLNKSEYTGHLTAVTDTVVTADVEVTGYLRFRGMGYMTLDASEGCAGMRLNMTVTDEYTLKPIDGVVITAVVDGRIAEEVTTNSEGKAFFIPNREGLYNLTARKDGYKEETTIEDLVLCGLEQTCEDGIENQGESAVDCGGPCPPCNCLNAIQDEDENGVDCGGSCPPCHCSDGVYNQDEEGIDCGGKDCLACPEFNLVPTLVINHPRQVISKNNVSVQVLDDQDRQTQALLTIESPDGKTVKGMTNRTGAYSFNATEQGIWRMKATKAGYLPTSSSILVVDEMTFKAVSSLIMVLFFGILAYLYLKKQRALVVADAETIRRLTVEGRFGEYKRLYVTKNMLEKGVGISEPKKIKAISLNMEEEAKADAMAKDYGLAYDTAELLVLCQKIKAKKFLTENDVPYELKQKLAPLAVKNIDDD